MVRRSQSLPQLIGACVLLLVGPLTFLAPGSLAQTTRPRFVYTAGSPITSGTNVVNAYTEDASTGAVSLVAGSPFSTGQNAMVVAADPAGRFLYVGSQSGISGYSIDANSGALTAVPGSPFPFVNLVGPGGRSSVVVDASGKFLYVAGSGYLSGYTIDPNTGSLSQLAGFPFNSGAVSVAADPLGKFLYVGNSNSISVFTINPTSGALTQAAGPFGGGVPYTTMAVTPNGQFLFASGTGIAAFSVNTTTGVLTPVSGSPFDTAVNSFVGLAIDPTGTYLYASSPTYLPTSTYGYLIDSVTGALTAVPGSPFSFPSTGGNAFYNFGVAVDASDKYVYVIEANLGWWPTVSIPQMARSPCSRRSLHSALARSP